MQLNLDAPTEKTAITLLRHLEWQADSFSLIFFFADVGPSNQLFDWLNERLILESTPLQHETVSEEFSGKPEDAVEYFMARLKLMSTNAGGIWYELHRYPTDDKWNEARRRFLARLNERRFLLENGLSRPLILVLPADFRSEARSIAPDIWHVRALSEELRAGTPTATDDHASNLFAAEDSPQTDIPAVAEWQRIQKKSGSGRINLKLAWEAVREHLRASRFVEADQIATQVLSLAKARIADLDTTAKRQLNNVRTEVFKEKASVGNKASDVKLKLNLQSVGQAFNDVFISLQIVGDVKQAQGQLDSAFEKYNEALAVARALYSDLGASFFGRNLGLCLSKIGNFEYGRGRLVEAESLQREALSVLRTNASLDKSAEESQRAIAVASNRLGHVLRQRGLMAEACDAYSDSIEARRGIFKVNNSRTDMRQIAISLAHLGKAELNRGNQSNAERALTESVEIMRNLVEVFEASSQALRDLSISLRSLAQVSRSRGDLRHAEEIFQEALGISRQIVERDGKASPALRDLQLSTQDLGEIALDSGNVERAMQLYEKSLEIARSIGQQTGWPTDALRDVSLILSRLANVVKLSGNLDYAEDLLVESVETDRNLLQRDPESVSLARDLAVSISDLGDLALEKNSVERAETLYKEAVEIAEKLLKGDRSPANLRDYSNYLLDLAAVAARKNDHFRAEDFNRRALEIARERLATSDNSPGALRQVSVILNHLHESLGEQKKYAEAKNACLESIEIDRELLERLGSTVPVLKDLATSISSLGSLAFAQGDYPGTLEAYRELLKLKRKLASLQPSAIEPLLNLETVLQLVAELLGERREGASERLRIYEELVVIRRKLSEYRGGNRKSLKELKEALDKVAKISEQLGDFSRSKKAKKASAKLNQSLKLKVS